MEKKAESDFQKYAKKQLKIGGERRGKKKAEVGGGRRLLT